MTAQLSLMPRTRHDELSDQVTDFHHRHPEVWEAFERMALDRWTRGFRHYSADALFHVVRFHTELGDDRGQWKINNSYTSFYARRFLRLHPECGDFFRTRIQISQRRRA